MGQVESSTVSMDKKGAQNCAHGLHRGQGDVSTESTGQVETSSESMGYIEDRERLLHRAWARTRPELGPWAR